MKLGAMGRWLTLAGALAIGAPLAAQAQAQDDDSAVFRTGLGVTSLKFTDRSSIPALTTSGSWTSV